MLPTLSFCKEHKDYVLIDVHINPKSRSNKIVGIYNNRLKINITQPPVDGKANKAVVDFIAKTLSVPKKAVSVVKGETNKLKVLRIDVVDRAILNKLREWSV